MKTIPIPSIYEGSYHDLEKAPFKKMREWMPTIHMRPPKWAHTRTDLIS